MVVLGTTTPSEVGYNNPKSKKPTSAADSIRALLQATSQNNGAKNELYKRASAFSMDTVAQNPNVVGQTIFSGIPTLNMKQLNYAISEGQKYLQTVDTFAGIKGALTGATLHALTYTDVGQRGRALKFLDWISTLGQDQQVILWNAMVTGGDLPISGGQLVLPDAKTAAGDLREHALDRMAVIKALFPDSEVFTLDAPNEWHRILNDFSYAFSDAGRSAFVDGYIKHPLNLPGLAMESIGGIFTGAGAALSSVTHSDAVFGGVLGEAGDALHLGEAARAFNRGFNTLQQGVQFAVVLPGSLISIAKGDTWDPMKGENVSALDYLGQYLPDAPWTNPDNPYEALGPVARWYSNFYGLDPSDPKNHSVLEAVDVASMFVASSVAGGVAKLAKVGRNTPLGAELERYGWAGKPIIGLFQKGAEAFVDSRLGTKLFTKMEEVYTKVHAKKLGATSEDVSGAFQSSFKHLGTQLADKLSAASDVAEWKRIFIQHHNNPVTNTSTHLLQSEKVGLQAEIAKRTREIVEPEDIIREDQVQYTHQVTLEPYEVALERRILEGKSPTGAERRGDFPERIDYQAGTKAAAYDSSLPTLQAGFRSVQQSILDFFDKNTASPEINAKLVAEFKKIDKQIEDGVLTSGDVIARIEKRLKENGVSAGEGQELLARIRDELNPVSAEDIAAHDAALAARFPDKAAEVVAAKDLEGLATVDGHKLLDPENMGKGSEGNTVAQMKETLAKEGWDPEHPLIVSVGKKGAGAVIQEGFTRARAALDLLAEGDKRFADIPVKYVDAEAVGAIIAKFKTKKARAKAIEALPSVGKEGIANQGAGAASEAAGITSKLTVGEEEAAQSAFAKNLAAAADEQQLADAVKVAEVEIREFGETPEALEALDYAKSRLADWRSGPKPKMEGGYHDAKGIWHPPTEKRSPIKEWVHATAAKWFEGRPLPSKTEAGELFVIENTEAGYEAAAIHYTGIGEGAAGLLPDGLPTQGVPRIFHLHIRSKKTFFREGPVSAADKNKIIQNWKGAPLTKELKAEIRNARTGGEIERLYIRVNDITTHGEVEWIDTLRQAGFDGRSFTEHGARVQTAFYDSQVLDVNGLSVADSALLEKQGRLVQVERELRYAADPEPIWVWPKASIVRRVLSDVPVTNFEKVLKMIYDHQPVRLPSLSDDMASVEKIHGPGKTGWQEGTKESIQKLMRKSFVPEDVLQNVLGRLSKVGNMAEYVDWMKSLAPIMRTALEKHAGARHIAPEVMDRIIEKFDHPSVYDMKSPVSVEVPGVNGGTTWETRNALTEPSKLPDGDATPIPAAHADVPGQREFSLPNLDDIVSATSRIRRWSRDVATETKTVTRGGTTKQVRTLRSRRNVPYELPKLALHLTTGYFKSPILTTRSPAMLMRIQIEQTFRNIKDGLKPVIFNDRLLGSPFVLKLEDTALIQKLFGEKGIFPHDFEMGRIARTVDVDRTEIGQIFDEMVEQFDDKLLSLDIDPQVLANPALLRGHRDEAKVMNYLFDRAHQLGGSYLDSKLALLGPEKFYEWLHSDAKGLYMFEHDIKPWLDRSTFTEAEWIRQLDMHIDQVSMGSKSLRRAYATDRWHKGERVQTSTSPGKGFTKNEYNQALGELDAVDASARALRRQIHETILPTDKKYEALVRQHLGLVEQRLRDPKSVSSQKVEGAKRQLDNYMTNEYPTLPVAPHVMLHEMDVKRGLILERINTMESSPGKEHFIDFNDKEAMREAMLKGIEGGDLKLPRTVTYNRSGGNSTYTNSRKKLIDQNIDAWNHKMYRTMHYVSSVDAKGTRGSAYRQYYAKVYTNLIRRGYEKDAAAAIAVMKAGKMTRDLMYDLSARTTTQRAMKDVFWFGPAWQEIMTTWFIKIPSASYWPIGMGHLAFQANLLVRGLKDLGVIQVRNDAEGKPMEIISFNWMRPVFEKLGIKTPDMVFGKPSGINIATAGLPGISPAIGAPLGMAARNLGGVYKALSDVFQPYGPDVTFMPSSLTYAWEALFGSEPPWNHLSTKYQHDVYQRSYDQAIQYAWQEMSSKGMEPPRIQDYITKTDPLTADGTPSEKSQAKYTEAVKDYWDELAALGKDYFHGIAIEKLIGATVSPLSLTASSAEKMAWQEFMAQFIIPEGFDPDGSWSQGQTDLIQSYLGDNPDSLGFATSYTIQGEATKTLPYSSTGADEYYDKLYTGELSIASEEEYLLKFQALESRRHFQNILVAAYDELPKQANKRLLMRYEVSDKVNAAKEQYDHYLAVNPDVDHYLQGSYRDWGEKYGIPVTAYAAEKTFQLQHDLRRAGAFFLGAGGLRTDAYREVLREITELTINTGHFGPDTTPVEKNTTWWYTKILGPYMKRTQPLYDQAQMLSDAGLYAGEVYDKVRAINEKMNERMKTLKGPDGKRYPTPEQYFYGNLSTREQDNARLAWATRPPAWLTPFQLQTAGMPRAKSTVEFYRYWSATNDNFYNYKHDNNIIGSSREGLALENERLTKLYAAAKQAGPEAIKALQLSEAPPVFRLDYVGFGGTNNENFQLVVQATSSIIERLKSDGSTASSMSASAIYQKAFLMNAIDTYRTPKLPDGSENPLYDKQFDTLWSRLGRAIAPAGQETREGVPLYAAILFNQFNDAYLGDLIEAVHIHGTGGY